jgi:hypothetical protein
MIPCSLETSADQQRHKVLFVASSLLEKYPSATEGHSYVTDFLAVVSPSQALVDVADRIVFKDKSGTTCCFARGGLDGA